MSSNLDIPLAAARVVVARVDAENKESHYAGLSLDADVEGHCPGCIKLW